MTDLHRMYYAYNNRVHRLHSVGTNSTLVTNTNTKLFKMVSRGLKAALGQYELSTVRNIRDNLPRTIRNGSPTHELCIPHRIPRA